MNKLDILNKFNKEELIKNYLKKYWHLYYIIV